MLSRLDGAYGLRADYILVIELAEVYISDIDSDLFGLFRRLGKFELKCQITGNVYALIVLREKIDRVAVVAVRRLGKRKFISLPLPIV